MTAATIEGGRKRRKDERVQAHWEVPGHVARVYNPTHKTAYTVSLIAGFWNCDCPYGQYGRGPCKHIVAVVDKVRREAAR